MATPMVDRETAGLGDQRKQTVEGCTSMSPNGARPTVLISSSLHSIKNNVGDDKSEVSNNWFCVNWTTNILSIC